MSPYADPTQHLFWLASRSVGIVALLLVAASVGLGLAMASRLMPGPGAPARAKSLHEALALAALIAIAAHGALLLGDSYLRPGLAASRSPSPCPTSRSGHRWGSSPAGSPRFSG